MADAYVNFFSALDPGGYTRGAQAFQGRGSQEHRAAAAVGGNAASPTTVALADGTEYAEIKAVSGPVFACILPAAAAEADRTAARIRIDEGEKVALTRALKSPATLYIWAV